MQTSHNGLHPNEALRLMTTIQINPNELPDKRVLVTGGTKGMGEAIVKRMKQAVATVITTARSKPEEVQSPDLFAVITEPFPVRLIDSGAAIA